MGPRKAGIALRTRSDDRGAAFAHPDLSDIFPAPRCDADLHRRYAEAVVARPLPFSRLLVAQLRTTWGVSGVLDLVDLPETQITPYALAPEESGPPPSRRWVRYRALLHAPQTPESTRRLFEVLSRTNDPLDVLILHPLATQRLDDRPPVRGEPAPAEVRSIVDRWLEDVPRRLAGHRAYLREPR